MDKELETLITTYKKSLESLSQINNEAEKLNVSEVLANHLSLKSTNETDAAEEVKPSDLGNNDSNKKINEIINKLRSEVDIVSNKRLALVDTSKSAVQSYIDNTIWKLSSFTDLKNNTLSSHNHVDETDKKCLLELISSLLVFEKHIQTAQEDSNEPDKETMIFSSQLHEWLIHVITVYLRMSTNADKRKLLPFLTTIPNIASWAIPLIQFSISNVEETDEYIEALNIVFCNNYNAWTEDDFLMVLDQLAIDYNYNKAIETIDSPEILLDFSNKLTATLTKAITDFNQMNNLLKRISQTVIQISILLVDKINEKEWKCQDQIDTFLKRLINTFYTMEQTGWFFLPNIPFKALSVDALWEASTELLQIKNDSKPSSLKDVLDDHLPNITRFQYKLEVNQMQGYFMLSCLTNIALALQDTSTLSNCIVAIMSYALFTVAFIHKDLREIFYKDVRDNMAMICRCHPFVIPIVFQWTVDNLNVMERMSLYLFHSIRLDQWDISEEDLKKVHKLISSTNSSSPLTSQQTAQLQLGKHILSQLNYGYKHDCVDLSESKSQPWHQRKLPFLSYETHEEIAFILLNVCQQFQPLPDAGKQENKGAIELVGNVMSSYLPITDQIQLLKSTSASGNEIIQWAWSIAVRLKLYDCPISSRATDIENSIDLPFLKLVLNSYNAISASHSALLVYISFMLSATSRHFLRFESSDGWMKLLVILKRGKSEAIIHMFSEIVPSFVYMHGDDFFNDESLIDLLRHMVELKADPMLMKGASQLLQKQQQTIHGIGLIIGSHMWQAHLIDSVMDKNGKGFSYVDLMMHSWMKTVLRRPDWMWQSNYVSVIDVLCRFAFIFQKQNLVYHMLEEEQKRMEAVKTNNSAGSPRLTRLLKNMVVSEDTFTTLLVGEWSMLKTNTFYKTPGVEGQYFWFAFQVLIMETLAEKPYLDEMSQVISKQLSTKLANDQQQPQEQQQNHKSSIELGDVFKMAQVKKPLDFFAIYRWLQHITAMPVKHPLLPLYCQVFLELYYQIVDAEHKLTLGYLFFNKRKDQVSKLRDYIANAQTFYGQQIEDANAQLLRQFYYAVWLWLGNDEILNLEINIHSLPSHYETTRLLACHGLPEPSDKYWMDLVNIDHLEQEFLNFSWEGSDKFRISQRYDQQSLNNTDDSVSLSTTTRRLRLLTDGSMIAPLPSIVINTPINDTPSKKLSSDVLG